MARKLIYGNDILGFNPSAGILTVRGYVPTSKLLLVNNQTINTSLFNFSDPSTVATSTYNTQLNQTTIDLSTNTSSMNPDDKLQVYYEIDEVIVEPAPALVDPVSRLKVSEGQSLIDTDFEYGTQTSKWDQIKLVNNIPTKYSLSHITPDPISLNHVKINASSTTINVESDAPHKLIPGAPVEITGLTEKYYEGVHLVASVQSDYSFTYKVRAKSNKSKNLVTPYSLLYPGSFHTGAGVDFVDADTDAQIAPGSTITVYTPSNHGFNDGTKLYLKQSRTTKVLRVNGPPDNIIAGTAFTTLQSTITSSTVPDDNRYFASRPIIIDDWLATKEINIPFTSVNTTNGIIAYNASTQVGSAATSPIVVGDAIAFYGPVGNTLPGGISTFSTYYVYSASTIGVGTTAVTYFNFASSWGSTTPFTPSSTGNTLYGNHRIVVGAAISFTRNYQIGKAGKFNVITTRKNHGLVAGDKIVIVSPSAFSNLTRTRSNHNPLEYTYYYVKSTPSPTTLTVSFSPTGSAFNLAQATPVASNIPLIFKVYDHPFANCVYLPPQVGYSTTPFSDADYVVYRGSGAVGFLPNGLTLNEPYFIDRKFDNQYWYRINPKTKPDLDAPINLTYSGAAAGNVFAGIHTFTMVIPDVRASSMRIPNPARGGLNNNAYVQYSSGVSVTPVGGLLSNGYYNVKTHDSTLIVNPGVSTVSDRFRLSLTSTEGSIWQINYYYNSPNMEIWLNQTNVAGIGISVGRMIQVTGYNGTAFQNRIVNGLHYVTGIATYYGKAYNPSGKTRLQVYYPNEPITDKHLYFAKNKWNSVSIPKNSTSLINTKVTGIVSFTNAGGIGTHFLTISDNGAADGLYEVGQCIGTTFILDTQVEIPYTVRTITGGAGAGNVGIGTTIGSNQNSSYIRLLNHNFADGTKVIYNAASTPIGGLTTNTTYYVRVFDKNFIGLSTDPVGSIDRTDPNNPGLVSFTSLGSTAAHSFTSYSIKGFITGTGTIGFTTTSKIITGTSTCKFNSDFTIGDVFRVYSLGPTGAGPGTYFESRITTIRNNRILKIADYPEYNSSAANYFIATRFYPISESRLSHRPFDGSVAIDPGLIPNTQVIRQSRKYFKYQSGKGIQCSMAVNFNSAYDIDFIRAVGTVGVTTIARINTKYPHNLTEGAVDANLRIKISGCEGPYQGIYNGDYDLIGITDDYNFTIALSSPVPNQQPLGFPRFSVSNWSDVNLKCGMFDDQNGFFFKYDGNTLYTVRRSSTTQLSGFVNVDSQSTIVTGNQTRFTEQLKELDRIVIRGQTYKIIKVVSDRILHIQPGYRAPSAKVVIASKVIDTEVPQSNWSIDPCDGTGRSGYNIDINKIQMVYMDYSWYGAGKIRFGFRDQIGNIKYVHEFIHNNVFTEAYFRSGNLPVRYEVETFDTPLFSPTLSHWGVSVIMDGKFNNDKSYLYNADSYTLPFTNGGYANNGTGTRPVGTVAIGSTIISAINSTEASTLAIGEIIEDSANSNTFASGTTITGIEMDQTTAANRYSNIYQLTVSSPAKTAGSKTFHVYSGTSAALKDYIPLISVRLAPSADNSLTGDLGYRDLINRMQIELKDASILATHDCEAALFLNAELSDEIFVPVGPPSLSQVYKHAVNDFFVGGTKILSFRAHGGSLLNATSGKRGLNLSKVSLAESTVLGNSILGGNRVFPDGPDVATLCVKPVDTSLITGSSPFLVSGRLTWKEAQA
jgi:hypothetical protein